MQLSTSLVVAGAHNVRPFFIGGGYELFFVPPLQGSDLLLPFPGAHAPGYYMVQTGRIVYTFE